MKAALLVAGGVLAGAAVGVAALFVVVEIADGRLIDI